MSGQSLKDIFARSVWAPRVQDHYEVGFREEFVTALKGKLTEFLDTNTGIPGDQSIDAFCAGIDDSRGLAHHVRICLNRAKKDTEVIAQRFGLN